MSELVFLFSADADIQTAYEFYEAYQVGRGEIFMRHLDAGFGRVRTFPEIAPIFHRAYRRCSSPDFPTVFFTRSRDGASSSPE